MPLWANPLWVNVTMTVLHRHFIPWACGQNVGPPIRPFDAGGHRLRVPCNQGTHGCKPHDDGHWRVRPRVPKRFLEEVTLPSLQGLLPFVRATHSDPTSYVWEDEATGGGHHTSVLFHRCPVVVVALETGGTLERGVPPVLGKFGGGESP